MRQVATICINRFFSQGALSRVASSKAGLEAMKTIVKKPMQLADALSLKEVTKSPTVVKESIVNLKQEIRQITQKERDDLCALLKEASSGSSYY